MRLSRLHLARYGHFRDRSLALRPGARLHVVYGPNEAGKSSALTAVTDLLFGIPRKSRYEVDEMRLGAEIVGADATRIVFERRKGMKRTLFSPQGEPLGEDALAPFLGGVTREVFCRAFGLDAASLREGAHEMLRSEGETGESLFAAASGLRDIAAMRRTLDEEAEEIFIPKGKNRVLNKLLERRAAAAKDIRSTELRSSDWNEITTGIEDLTRQLAELGDERSRLLGEGARLRRLKRIAPLIGEIDALIESLKPFDDLPALTDAAIDDIGTRLAARRTCEAERQRAELDLARAAAELDRIAVDGALLAGSAEIVALFSETGAYKANRRDLPRISIEVEEFRIALDGLAVRIGLPDAQAVQARQPSEADKARIDKLILEGRSLDAAQRGLERDLSEARARLAEGERRREDRSSLVDPAPLRDRLRAVEPVLRDLGRRDDLVQNVASEARAIAAAAARLTPPIRDIDIVARSPLPSPDVVTRFSAEFDALARQTERAAERVQATARATAEIVARLKRREESRAVPSAAMLASLRADRDGSWRQLRATLLGGTGSLVGASLLECLAAFERGTAEADRVADAMAGDAKRAAEHAADHARLGEEAAASAAARAELSEVDEARPRLESEWTACWAPAAIVPGEPAKMAAWLVDARAILARRDSLDVKHDALHRLEARIEGIRPSLIAVAHSVGQSGLEALEIGLIAGQVAGRLDALASIWETARDSESRQRAIAQQIEQWESRRIAVADELRRWSAAWLEALPALGLRDGAGIDEAEAALAAWREAPSILRERDNRERRVAGMERDMRGYETRVRATLQALAPDLAEVMADLAVATLNTRLEAERGAETRRQALLARKAETERQAAEVSAETGRIGAALDALATACGFAPGADLDAIHARLAARRDVAAKLRARRADLALHAEHVEEAVLRADLRSLAPGEIDADLARLTLAEGELERRGQEIYARRVDLDRRRLGCESGVGAELATAAKRSAEVELRAAVRRWAVLKLGALLIATAVERHRTGKQDPLVARAGILFSQLTGGAFVGLAQDFDENDIPRLGGRRASGSVMPVEALSEGTRDQLYLALRLAYLEDFAARASPVPFIGDDLFSTFDDERTVHGLEALATIGERIQPILFTHHRHVADLAQTHLQDQVDIVAL